MDSAGFRGSIFPLDQRSLSQGRGDFPVVHEKSSYGQPVRDDVRGKGPLKPVESTADINMPMEGGKDAIVNESYNVEVMAYNESPMEGGENIVSSNSYNVEPMLEPRFPMEAGEDTDGSQGINVGGENVIIEENEEDEELPEDPDFRESDEEGEDEEDDLFFSTSDSEAYESELRAWLGRELGGRDHDMEDEESEYDNTEILRSLSDSSDSDVGVQRKKRYRYPQFNEETDLQGEVVLEKGMEFSSHKLFKEALREYAVQKGFDYDFQHNESKVVAAYCKKRCGWYIRASLSAKKSSFQIKTFKKEHNCGRQGPSSKIDYKWLAKKFMEEIRDMPKMDIGAFQNMIAKKFGVETTRSQCYRARKRALEILEGDHISQYKLLWNYCHILLETNPGSSVKMMEANGVFQRLYICFAACKDGFKHCRPVIGLDGCHIKGGFPGQLLCAIGIDANDNMFPIAHAVVEVENTTSWGWFIENLLHDVGSVADNKWTFMFDQQKGLVNILADYVEPKDHRICVRHLYENFKKKYPGREFKNALWACARATTEVQFNSCIERLRSIAPNSGAVEWLLQREPERWARHKFSSEVKCDILLNNISETFNSFILKAREKPIITMLEMIRRMLMKRFHLKMTGMERLNCLICPRIQKKLDWNKRAAFECIAHCGRGTKIEVEHCFLGREVVDVNNRNCTCRKLDLSGIPCVHACAAISFLRLTHEDYVDKCYHRELFLKTYEPIMQPVPGPQNWPQTPYTPVAPPMDRRRTGRPKRLRKRSQTEPPAVAVNRINKDGTIIRCGNCNGVGHNVKTCKATPDPVRAEKMRITREKAAMRRRAKKAAVSDHASHVQSGNAS